MDEKDYLIEIEKLLAKIAELECLVLKQAEQIQTQALRIKQLEKQLLKNSKNSSKPPSSDGLKKSNNSRKQSLRESGNKQNGGQPGHTGQTLKQSSQPDRMIMHELSHCPGCSASLITVATEKKLTRQVFDIPPPKLQVTEHQGQVKTCPRCGVRATSVFPDGVNAPTQYGPVIQSYAVYLQQQQLLPEARLQEIFSDLFNVKLAKATLASFSQKAAKHLADFEAHVFNQLQLSKVKHLDETGFRIGGKTQWLHVASNNHWTYYHHSPKRKSLLEGLQGMIVHDHWRPYYQINDVKHVLCNAHHLRELKSLMEDQEQWAHQMSRLLRLALEIKYHYGGQGIPQQKQQRLLSMYDWIIKKGLAYHNGLPPYKLKPRRGRCAHRTGYNLLVRLRDYRSDATRFITEIDAPFTNNLAERDLRMMKVKQKISGGFRSDHGATTFVRIRSLVSTARKQGWSILDCIAQATCANFLLPSSTRPG